MKLGFSLIVTAALFATSVTTTAATLVDTGEPVSQTLNGSAFRAGEVTFTSNVQIDSVQHFARVVTPGEITFALRRDNAGLPGDEVFSTVTTLSVTGVTEWLNIGGLHWSVPAGKYWVSVEERVGQTATLVRPLGSIEDGTFPPNPLAAEALQSVPDTSWFAAGGKTGWRVSGEFAPGIYGVGDLPGGAFFSEIRDATKVNGVIMAVGNSARTANAFAGNAGVLWTSDRGLQELPPVVRNDVSGSLVSGRDITSDGRAIAGSAFSSATINDRAAVIVTDNGTTNVVLGSLSASRVIAYANAISDDGMVAYGSSFANFGNEVFRWSPSTGIVGLGFLNPADDTSAPAARGVSSDGSVMVGISTAPPAYVNRAFRYVHGFGMTALPLLPGGAGNNAIAVTTDGNVVLGWGDSPVYPNGEFIRWNTSAGTTEALGSPEPTLIPRSIGAITADGQVAIVSYNDIDITLTISYLRNAHGWFELNAVMADAGVDLAGWVLDGAWGVSSDGTLLFGSGQHNGDVEGWVSELPANFLRDYGAPAADTTPPVIAPLVGGTAGDNGWYRSNVTVNWNVTDAESDISASQGCGQTTVTRDTTGTTFTCTATSEGGTSSASVTIKRDTIAPIAVVLSPLPGLVYERNQRIPALYLCLDVPSGIAQCAGTVAVGLRIDTATKGNKSFAVNARDQAGNTRTITVPYRVK
jgi:hypothetical protein